MHCRFPSIFGGIARFSTPIKKWEMIDRSPKMQKKVGMDGLDRTDDTFFGVGENPFLSPDLPLLMPCVINILFPNFSVQHFYRVLFLKPINYGKSRFRPGVDVGIIKARYRPKSRIRFIFRWEIKRFFRNRKVEHLLLTIFFVCGSSLTCCLLLCAGKMGKWEESPHTEHSPLSLLEKYSSNMGGGGEGRGSPVTICPSEQRPKPAYHNFAFAFCYCSRLQRRTFPLIFSKCAGATLFFPHIANQNGGNRLWPLF